jgi:hypothetical protein
VVTGHWDGALTGTFVDAAGATGPAGATLSIDFVQSGGDVTGTLVETNRICANGVPCAPPGDTLTAPLTGTVSGNAIQFQAPYCGTGPLAFNGTWTATNVNGTVIICTPSHGSGTFTLTKR